MGNPESTARVAVLDEELCKPLLQLFYTLGASEETLSELESTLQYFLDTKNKRKGQTLEAVIYPIVLDAVVRYGETISSTELWEKITSSLDGTLDEKNPNIFHSSDYGDRGNLYRNTITNMVCDKFGAEAQQTRKGYILSFNVDHLRKISKIYGTDTQIKTRSCEHVNTVNKDVTESTVNLTSENQESPSVHDVNDVNVFTDKVKCPYCDYEEHPFYLKIHIRNVHPEQGNE